MKDAPYLSLTPMLAAKIGSALMHADEASSKDGHAYDWAAFRALAGDADVQNWMSSLARDGLLPVRRINPEAIIKELKS